MERRDDYLVIGSGIAGLFFALEAAQLDPTASIVLVTKKGETETSTNRAQGGIASVLAGADSFDAHIEDTLKAGCGLCHIDVVDRVVRTGPEVIQRLIDYGARFTRKGDQFDLGREGGHSAKRVVHAADFTGREIERALLRACREAPNIELLRDHIVLDLMTYESGGEHYCAGAYVFSEEQGNFVAFHSTVTLLATGGLGQIYYNNTNPRIATGDGVAIAYRAGVSVGNLEFVQFHPTALYTPGRWPFLISEAVRGEGARLKSVDGLYFMEDVHKLKELAPRDVVARAIDRELKQSGEEYVLLDITHVSPSRIKRRFPNIYKECLRRGFDMTQRSIPVVPAAHYSCGGVVSTIEGETVLRGLYTAGEVAMTGMHGANRLASNSLLEAVVMAQLAAGRATSFRKNAELPSSYSLSNSLSSSLASARNKIVISHDRQQLQRIMSDFVGIVRNIERMEMALEKVQFIRGSVEQHYRTTPATCELVELRNMATVAELIITCALSRKESRGLQCLEDYPITSQACARDTIVEGTIDLRKRQ